MIKNRVKELVRLLRVRQTEAEQIFWGIVRNRKFYGKKFLRQYPIRFKYKNINKVFIADFYCYDSNLVVEVDGGIHEKQKEYDKLRELIINKLGFSVIRIKNEDLYGDLEKVKTYLLEFII